MQGPMEQKGGVPGIDPSSYTQLFLDSDGKLIRWRKESLFNKECWSSGRPREKKEKEKKQCELNPITYTTIN